MKAEELKTVPTCPNSCFQTGVMSLWTLTSVFSGTPCRYIITVNILWVIADNELTVNCQAFRVCWFIGGAQNLEIYQYSIQLDFGLCVWTLTIVGSCYHQKPPEVWPPGGTLLEFCLTTGGGADCPWSFALFSWFITGSKYSFRQYSDLNCEIYSTSTKP